MNSLLLLITAVVPAVPSYEVPDPAAQRIEARLLRALRSADEDERYRLVWTIKDHFADAGRVMSSPDRRRVAFLAGLLLQTCDVKGVRIVMSWLFQTDLHDRDGLPAYGALLDYAEDAKAWDAALLKMPLLAVPTQTASGQMAVVWAKFAAVRPAVRIPHKRRP